MYRPPTKTPQRKGYKMKNIKYTNESPSREWEDCEMLKTLDPQKKVQHSEASEAFEEMVKRLNDIDGSFYWEEDVRTIRAALNAQHETQRKALLYRDRNSPRNNTTLHYCKYDDGKTLCGGKLENPTRASVKDARLYKVCKTCMEEIQK